MIKHLLCVFGFILSYLSFASGKSDLTINDELEFFNIKEKYCREEKVTLKFNIPNYIPANTKFNVYVQNYISKFHLGTTTQNSIEVQMPDFNLDVIYFALESEDGKYKTSSKSFDIVGAAKPYIIAQITSSNISSYDATHCEGSSTKLLIRSPESVNFQWLKNGIDIPGANDTYYDAKDAGIYTVKATYSGCSKESTSIKIKVGEIPQPSISSFIRSQYACNGFSVPIQAFGDFPYTIYSWQHNGQTVEQKTQNDLFEAKKSGYYKVTAHQGSCKASSDSLWIEIGQKLTNSISTYNYVQVIDSKITLCNTLTATFTHLDYYVSNNDDSDVNALNKYGFNFQWKRNDESISGATKRIYTASEPGVYYLQLTQGDCIVNSRKYEIVRRDTLLTKIGHKLPFSDAQKTISLCKSTNNYGINVSPIYSEIWAWNIDFYKDGKLLETRTANKGMNTYSYFEIKDSGKYSAKIYPPDQKTCIALTDTAVFNLVDDIVQFPTSTYYFCEDPISISTPFKSKSYEWKQNNETISNASSLSINKEGTYTLDIKETNTCGYKKTFIIKKGIQPELAHFYNYHDYSTNSIDLCYEKQASIIIKNINYSQYNRNPDYSFEWYINQQKVPFSDYSLDPQQSGIYQAKVKYKSCEAFTNTLNVEITSINNQISPHADSMGICANSNPYILEAVSENGYRYKWFKDDVVMGETTSSLKATQPGTYKALIQYKDCESTTRKIKIYSNIPTATISGDTTLNIGDTANLKLSFTASPPFSYKLSNNETGVSEKNTIIHPVKVIEGNIFKLTSVSNTCGEGTVSGEAKIQVLILANEPLIGHKITIAPVPAESYCEMTFDLPISQEVSYQLLDMKGRQLSEKNLGNITYKKQYLNLNQLSAGEYLIRIQVGKDLVTRKLIKY
ncbi:T9SS type A sorting domain-containing protein [Emticicia sp. 21SJ11W-3]|uniref:T9SS type A sorting domain-containing protein n=1 Tax=Emticicia sp. 21SJ11W-3 TaxID=2916755 RepID=UPI0020A185CC|nr:T9SS type A sorting domain-containing protein [Emticicia sp. 21SJ11W-3]UTA68091.1 T9SS type A sorting domain-containing protein [Emticicia sp. 21SJ11W-3]